MSETKQWMRAYLFSIYMIYSQLIIVLSVDLSGKDVVVPISVALLPLLMSVISLHVRSAKIGVIVVCSVAIEIVLLLYVLKAGVFYRYIASIFMENIVRTSPVVPAILLGITIIPAIVIGTLLFKDANTNDQQLSDDEDVYGRQLFTRTLLLLYFIVFALIIWRSTAFAFAIAGNQNIVYAYTCAVYGLVAYFGIKIFHDTEMARRISIAMPITFLYYSAVIFVANYFVDYTGQKWVSDYLTQLLVYYYSSHFVLFFLSLPNYRWRREQSW